MIIILFNVTYILQLIKYRLYAVDIYRSNTQHLHMHMHFATCIKLPNVGSQCIKQTWISWFQIKLQFIYNLKRAFLVTLLISNVFSSHCSNWWHCCWCCWCCCPYPDLLHCACGCVALSSTK